MIEERIKLRHLQCMLAVAQLGSVQKAAQALAISQPAVSKTVTELEALLGVRLLERNRKGAELTAAGAAFLRHAQHSVSALKQAVASIAPGPQHSAPVVLGVLPTVAPSLVPKLIAQLDQRADRMGLPAPRLRVYSQTNPELLGQLRQGQLDLVIGRFAEPQVMRGLSFEHLYTDPLVLVVRRGHPLLRKRQADILTRLKAYRLILPLPGTAIRHATDALLAQQGAEEPPSTVETLSISLARQQCLNSNAIWFTREGAITPDLEQQRLSRLPVQTGRTEEMIGLIQRADSRLSSAPLEVAKAIRSLGQRRPRA
jgi:LysR family pca operon transcriptional activator